MVGQINEAVDTTMSPEEGATWNLGINFEFAVDGFDLPALTLVCAPTQLAAQSRHAGTDTRATPVTQSDTAAPTHADNLATQQGDHHDRNKLAESGSPGLPKYTSANSAFSSPTMTTTCSAPTGPTQAAVSPPRR